MSAFLWRGGAEGATGGEVVAGAGVADLEVGEAAVGGVDEGFAEEAGLAPHFGALAGGEPEVDLFEVVGAVVAGDAFEVDAEEEFGGVDGDFVGGIFVVHLVAVAFEDVAAGEEVGGAGGPGGDGGGGEEVADEFVVGDVEGEGFVDVVVEGVDAFLEELSVAEEVVEEVGPAVEEGGLVDGAHAADGEGGRGSR